MTNRAPDDSALHVARYQLRLVAPSGNHPDAVRKRKLIEELKYHEAAGTHLEWVLQALLEKANPGEASLDQVGRAPAPVSSVAASAEQQPSATLGGSLPEVSLIHHVPAAVQPEEKDNWQEERPLDDETMSEPVKRPSLPSGLSVM